MDINKVNIEIIKSLLQHKIFTCITETDLDIIAQNTVHKFYKKKDCVDINTKYLYYVINGTLIDWHYTKNGKSMIYDIFDSGSCMGLKNIKTAHTQNCNITSLKNASVLLIPFNIINNIQCCLQTINNLIIDVLERKEIQLEHMYLQSTSQRICCFLLTIINPQKSNTITLPYKKNIIARLLGMNDETFSRACTKLTTATGMTIKNDTFFIPDIEKMISYACNECTNEYSCISCSGLVYCSLLEAE